MSAAAPEGRLARRMGLPGVLFLTLSAATPASSLFVIVPDVIRQAGTGAALSLGLAAVVALLVAASYAELASAFPHAGGEYVMVGATLGPGPGFVTLALNLLNSVLTGAVFALGVAEYLHALWPGAPARPVALAVVAAATGLSLLDVRAGAWTTGAFLLVELLALGVVAALGFVHPARGAAALLHPVAAGAGGAGLHATPALALGLSAAVALFAFDGYGSAVYFAEETVGARRRLGRAVLLAWGVTVAAELVPTLALLLGAPDLARLFAAPAPVGGFVADRGGAPLAAAVDLAVALAIGNAVAAFVLLTARQLYATARDRAWPAPLNRALAGVDARTGAPRAATLAAGGAMAALCFVDGRTLLILTGTSITLIYAALQLAVLAGRRSGATAGGAFRTPAGAAAPALALLACALVLASDAADPAEGRPSLLAALAVAALAAAWWAGALRPRGWRPQAAPEEGERREPPPGGPRAGLLRARRSRNRDRGNRSGA